ncbi:flavin reductase family protein [Actinokineospora sp. NBRC 105648]|uniref:flavin reductase family protein n=1 Tax=Actinokineospora sp. NBRC 105648 TaxID=3032206 RepID=UPI002557A8DD|nr:flavin reductase family protein [Actinokineospora sp. NBRC 105648]
MSRPTEVTRDPRTTDTALAGLPQDLDQGVLRAAFGAFPTGVVAVAARVDNQVVGIAASSFTSVSLDPPLVSFAISTTSRTWPALRRADHLGVTVLADHHDRVARQLAGPADTRFANLDTTTDDNGAVTLPDGVAWFDTTIHHQVEAGDHTIVLLRLHAVAHVEHKRPLVFHRSGFGLHRPT